MKKPLHAASPLASYLEVGSVRLSIPLDSAGMVRIELRTKRGEDVSIVVPAATLERWAKRQMRAEVFA